MKSFNDLHYLPMSRIILPLCIILPPYHFAPYRFAPPPGNHLMIYAIYPCPVSFCPLDSFYPHIILPPIILPPPPPPWKSLNMHYLPMSRIILSPYHFAPYHFAPHPIILPPGNCFIIYTIYLYPVSFCPLDSFSPHIILPPGPGNGLMIYTIYPCPVSFCHCIRLHFHTNKKPFTTKAYDRRASGDCGTSGVNEGVPYNSC